MCKQIGSSASHSDLSCLTLRQYFSPTLNDIEAPWKLKQTRLLADNIEKDFWQDEGRVLCYFIDLGMTWSICISAWKSAFRLRWFRWVATRHFTVICFPISTLGEHGDTWHSFCRMCSSVQLCKLTMSFRGQNNRTILFTKHIHDWRWPRQKELHLPCTKMQKTVCMCGLNFVIFLAYSTEHK